MQHRDLVRWLTKPLHQVRVLCCVCACWCVRECWNQRQGSPTRDTESPPLPPSLPPSLPLSPSLPPSLPLYTHSAHHAGAFVSGQTKQYVCILSLYLSLSLTHTHIHIHSASHTGDFGTDSATAGGGISSSSSSSSMPHAAAANGCMNAGTHFTCFTGTKVQILTCDMTTAHLSAHTLKFNMHPKIEQAAARRGDVVCAVKGAPGTSV